MKEFFTRLLDKPALYMLTIGVLFVLLAAAGTITWQGQTIAVADTAWRLALSGAGALLAFAGIALIVRDTRNPRPRRPFNLKYDVFLASPMAALSDADAFKAQRVEIDRIKTALRSHGSVSTIYDAGEGLKPGKWNPNDFAADVDLEALRHSRYFMLIYSAKLASSVLFEAGYAVGMGKPAVYVVRNPVDLPFLMQQLNQMPRHYPQVRIWVCADTDAIVRRIETMGKQIFTANAADVSETEKVEAPA